MIELLASLPIGNAVRVFLKPPASSKRCRVLRKETDDIVDAYDDGAVIVYEGSDKNFIDTDGLVNGQQYFYRPFYFSGNAFIDAESASVTPLADYEDTSTDVLSIVLQRLKAGLQVELARGTLKHENGEIPVLTAPPIFEETKWPIVTIHLQNESPHTRALGEVIGNDEFDSSDRKWTESEGYLAKVHLHVIGWALNPDVRIVLRKALRRIVVANFPVFDDAGMLEVEFSQQDMEELERYGTPIYQALGSFTCLAPIIVSDKVGSISNVTSSVQVAL